MMWLNSVFKVCKKRSCQEPLERASTVRKWDRQLQSGASVSFENFTSKTECVSDSFIQRGQQNQSSQSCDLPVVPYAVATEFQ